MKSCYCPLHTEEISLNIISRGFLQTNPLQLRKLSRIVCIPLTVAVGTSQPPWDQMERDAEVTTNHVPYQIVINSHWEPSLPNAPGKDKLWEKASPEAKRSGSQDGNKGHLYGEEGGTPT